MDMRGRTTPRSRAGRASERGCRDILEPLRVAPQEVLSVRVGAIPTARIVTDSEVELPALSFILIGRHEIFAGMSIRLKSGRQWTGAKRMTARFESVDEYLSALPVQSKATLTQLREIIISAAPSAIECISYQMPALKQ